MQRVRRAEILRKMLHLVTLCLPFGILYLPGDIAAMVFVSVAALMVGGEILRQKWPFLQWLLYKLFGSFMRASERQQFTGATYYCVSAVICLFLFDVHIAFTVTAFMIVGDAAAALVGLHFGKIRIASGKSIEGMLACIAACMLFWLLFPVTGLATSLAAAFLTGVLEILPLKINDNLFVPVTCGTILQTWLWLGW